MAKIESVRQTIEVKRTAVTNCARITIEDESCDHDECIIEIDLSPAALKAHAEACQAVLDEMGQEPDVFDEMTRKWFGEVRTQE